MNIDPLDTVQATLHALAALGTNTHRVPDRPVPDCLDTDPCIEDGMDDDADSLNDAEWLERHEREPAEVTTGAP